MANELREKVVERALFNWYRWRASIIKMWVESKSDNAKELQCRLNQAVASELKGLRFPASYLMEIYWISCITSGYSLDYPVTYDKIVTPEGLQHGRYGIQPGIRAYPPVVVSDGDLKFYSRQYGFSKETLIDLYSNPSSPRILLRDHELLEALKKIRRPSIHGKSGATPRYSDRLAVQCAALKDVGMSYVEIAKRLHIRWTRPNLSDQSDTTVHLVQRGIKLLKEIQ